VFLECNSVNVKLTNNVYFILLMFLHISVQLMATIYIWHLSWLESVSTFMFCIIEQLFLNIFKCCRKYIQNEDFYSKVIFRDICHFGNWI